MTSGKHFCVAPFVHSLITTKEMEICCMNVKHSMDLTYNNIKNVWNSKRYQLIRQKMLNDEPLEGCETCYMLDEINATSDRATYNKLYAGIELNVETGNNFNVPLSYDLRNSNLCNLKCVMCSTASSSQLQKDYIENKEVFDFEGTSPLLSTEKYNLDISDLNDMILNLDSVSIKLLGGEPSIIPEHFNLLDTLLAANKTDSCIDITTNLTNLNSKFKTILSSFKDMRLQVSIDGLGKVVEYIRHPLNFDKWNENLNYVKNLELNSKTLNCAVQALNLFQLPEFVRFAKNLSAKHNFGYTFALLNTPNELSIKKVPFSIREKIGFELMQEYNTMDARSQSESKLLLIINECLEDTGDEDIKPMALILAKQDVVRNQHIKDFIPEIYELIKNDYDSYCIKLKKLYNKETL